MKPARDAPLLHKGDVVGEGESAYIVQRKLGEGQFAEVWEVKQPGSSYDVKCALKLEKRKDRNTVKLEYKALSKLRGNSQVIGVEGCGTHDGHFYMLLQLAGETLYDARKNAPAGRMDLPTVKAVGLSTLAAIQQVHAANMIHRDIKPANFVINPPNSSASRGSWLLIDFGLVRRFVDDCGQHLPQRSDASFRGSTAYASVHAHREQDLSRRDDIWSWLYMLAELLDGGLPWRPDKDGSEHVHIDKHWVLQRKEECIQQPHLLCRSVELPGALVNISQHIASLAFEDAPNYEYLRQCLQELPDPRVELHDLAQTCNPCHQTPGSAAAAAGQSYVVSQPPSQHPNDSSILGRPDAWHHHPGQQQGQQQLLPMAASPPCGLQNLVNDGMQQAIVQVFGVRPPPEQDMEHMAKRQRNHSDQAPIPTQVNQTVEDDGVSNSHGSQLLQEAGAEHEGQAGPYSVLAHQACNNRHHSSVDTQQQQQLQGVHSASIGGVLSYTEPSSRPSSRGVEIADLLAAFDNGAAADSRRATEQVVQQLCLLRPTEAVCAIALTVDKLVHQSEASCRPAVMQILQDLAAFIDAGVVSLHSLRS